MMNRRESIFAIASAFGAAHAWADDFPSRPIKIISPYAAGGGSDFLARFLSVKLTPLLGQTLVVENRAGAGGMLGTDFVAKSPPDGHTLLIGSNGPLAVFPALYAKLPYDPVRDLLPVSLLSKQPFVLVTGPSVAAKDFREFIADAKARPDALNFGTPGNGSAPHLAMEMLKLQAGIRMTHVPYKGGPPALTDVIAGQIQLATADPNTAMPLLKQGRLRALAVTSAKRSPLLPDVPTVAESGVPGYEVTGWFGVLVPKGTPQAVIDRLNLEIGKAMTAPDAKETLSGLGGELLSSSPAQFGEHIRMETVRWRQLIKDFNIKPES